MTLRNEDDARELLQTTYERAWKNRRQFELGTNIGGWLGTIMKNANNDRLKSHHMRRTSSIEEMGDNFDVETPGGQMTAVEVSEIEAWISTLPEEDQGIVVMSGLGSRSQEIADVLDLSVANVRTKLCRRRKEMHVKFRDRGTGGFDVG